MIYNQHTILDQLRTDQNPYWYLYDGDEIVKRSGETGDIEDSIRRLKTVLAELPNATYRLKAANNPRKHNGATWYDVAIETKSRINPKPMTGQSTNAFNIPDVVYNQIVQETERNLMFKQMYDRFNGFMEDWPRIRKMVEDMHKDFYEDADGNGIPDIAETIKGVASAAESASAVKKVFTGTGLFS